MTDDFSTVNEYVDEKGNKWERLRSSRKHQSLPSEAVVKLVSMPRYLRARWWERRVWVGHAALFCAIYTAMLIAVVVVAAVY